MQAVCAQIILPNVELSKEKKNIKTHLAQNLTVERKIDALKACKCWLPPTIEMIWNTELREEFDETTASDKVTSSASAEDPREVISYVIGEVQHVMELHSLSSIQAGMDENLTNLFSHEVRLLVLVQALISPSARPGILLLAQATLFQGNSKAFK